MSGFFSAFPKKRSQGAALAVAPHRPQLEQASASGKSRQICFIVDKCSKVDLFFTLVTTNDTQERTACKCLRRQEVDNGEIFVYVHVPFYGCGLGSCVPRTLAVCFFRSSAICISTSPFVPSGIPEHSLLHEGIYGKPFFSMLYA